MMAWSHLVLAWFGLTISASALASWGYIIMHLVWNSFFEMLAQCLSSSEQCQLALCDSFVHVYIHHWSKVIKIHGLQWEDLIFIMRFFIVHKRLAIAHISWRYCADNRWVKLWNFKLEIFIIFLKLLDSMSPVKVKQSDDLYFFARWDILMHICINELDHHWFR